MKEVWKSLNGIVECGDNYEVSDFGNVRSVDRINHKGRRIKGRILKFGIKGKGYLSVKLCMNGVEKNYQVHRLVAMAFIPNTQNKPQVNHKDTNKKNNKLSNLEWVTNSENQIHAVSNGVARKQIGEDRPASKLKENDVRKIREMYSSGKYSQRELAKMFGVGQRTITTIVNRITWKHID